MINTHKQTNRRMFHALIFAFLFSFVIPATAGPDYSGKKALERALLGNYELDYANEHMMDIWTLCSKLIQIKNFAGFDRCIAGMEEHHINEHGQLVYGGGFIAAGFFYSPDATSAAINGMKGLVAFDRSDLEGARHYNQLAVAATEGKLGISRKPHKKPKNNKGLNATLLPDIFGLAGLMAALDGDVAAAHEYRDKLDAIKANCMVCGVAKSMKRSWRARISLALGEYETAYETITEKSYDRGDLMETLFLSRLNPLAVINEAFMGSSFKEFQSMFTVETIAMLCHATWNLNQDQGIPCYKELLAHEFIDLFGGAKFDALNKLGEHSRTLDQDAEAEAYFIEAIDLLEAQRSTLALDTNKMGFVTDKLAVYRNLIDLYVDAEQFDQGLSYAERAKSRALVDLLAARAGGFRKPEGVSDEQMSELNRLETALTQFNPEVVNNNVRGLVLEQRKIISNSAPEFASVTAVAASKVPALQARLEQGEALVEYYGLGEDFYVFVLTEDGVSGTQLDGGELSAAVTSFRKAIQDPASTAYQRESKALYDRLVRPVEHLIADAGIVTIVPHGALHYLPFAALHDGEGYLLDRHLLRLLPSASVLEYLEFTRGHSDGYLVLGNPDLKNPALDLPGAETEARAISARTSGSELYLRGNATETLIKERGHRFGNLHIASHGVFNAEDPLSSGLLLSADGRNDGILTVDELYDLDLNADLVTLSACETALGEVTGGDDVVGFTRGFLYAGARSIVSSLWQVSDDATNILMQAFYDQRASQSKRGALRQAQLQLKDTGYSHPYYWAAFQLTGSI